ncbi:hypothetical protein Hanom_Chr03g00196821 [Helianthus anomalus]
MSWFNLNHIFSLHSESTVEGSAVPNSYDGRGNDDHAEEVVSGFRPHHNESLLLDLNEVSMIMGLLIMKPVTVPHTDMKNMAITFSLVVPRAYNKTFLSLLM